MDEELGRVNPNSFFEQLTEVRGTAQAAQKISNSNLSLLNELREKVEIISNDLRTLKGETDAEKDKAFEEEDKKQKEEMQARAKAQGEKTQEAVVGNKEGEGGTKGGGGGVMGFISSLIGGLVGGVAGLAIQGIGGIIGLGSGILNAGKKLGKNLAKGFSNLFGGKKNKKNGESKPVVSPDKLLNLEVDENKRGTGAKNRGREGGNFSGDQQMNERGEYAFKNKDGGLTEVNPEKSFSTSIKYSTKGNPETGEIEVDPSSLEPGVPLEKAEQHFYMSKIKELQFEIRTSKMEFGDDYDTSFMEKELEKFTKKYNDTLEFGGIDTINKDKKKKKNIFGFNFGGLVQGYNQGGEVDSVPAMLTPGEFVVTKDAVDKVGADTLKGLNASVGATNKASNLGSFSIQKLDPNDLSKDALVKKSSFIDGVKDVEISNESGTDYFRSTTDMSTGGINETTVQKTRFTETSEDGTVTVFSKESTMTEKTASIGVPDLIEHKDQLLGEIHKLKGFENVTIEDVINSTTGIPKETLLPILIRSDAQRATDKKQDKAMEEDRKARGIKPGQGFSMSVNDEVAKSVAGTMGYRIGQINPDMLVSSMTDFKEETKVVSKTGVKPKIDPLFSDLSASINASVKGYNEGGLVGSSITPIIESKNESGEMELIQNLSQSVDNNRQTTQLIGEQDQLMNAPNQNPNPVAPADHPQTSPTEIKDTEAPIPFAMLLRQNAQRYLNLGNNAMVIS